MLYLALFCVINIILAKYDANKIAKEIKIKHGINALIYSGLLIPVYLITKDWFLIAGLLTIRIPVFNTFLNYFRGISLTYISESTTSIVDQLTKKIVKKVGYWTYNIILIIISIILTLWQN